MAIKVGYSIWISNTVLGAMPKKSNNILPKNITAISVPFIKFSYVSKH